MSENKTNPNDEIQQFSRTQPFIEVNIAELTTSGKYKIIGTVMEIFDNSIIIDDGTDQLTIFFDDTPEEKPKEGDLIRVFGYLELEPNKQLKALIVQDISGINLETYQQIKDLEQSLRKEDA
jgi:hypothetical protein